MWCRTVRQGLCRDNTHGKGLQAGEQPVPQPRGREAGPCQGSREEAQRERKEAGWDSEASGPVSTCRPQGSSWVTQNNREAFSCKQHVLYAFVHFWEETAAGSPLRGQFIARHEGRVGWLKMLGSEGVKSLAGDVFLNRAS